MLRRFVDARIVAVDDTRANLDLLEMMLRRAGLHQVHTVVDPTAAMDVIAAVDPDLVLLDLHMPVLDGFVLLERIMRHAAGGYLPVLVLTADTTAEAAHRALAAGARDFLTKPFDVTEVLLRVGNLLETRELQQRLRRVSRNLATELSEARRHRTHRESVDNETRSSVGAVLADGGPGIAFQPIVELATGVVCGYEALARFGGYSGRSTEQWFTDASSVGLGSDLELAAVARALDEVSRLDPGVFVAVNVSPEVLLRPELADLVSPQIASRLVLELTEHHPVEDYAPVLRAIERLRTMGARLAVDDTGAGYSSLRHLLALSPDVIKLDHSLVRDIDVDPARRALASALVAFATDTGGQLVAEGVETPEELAVVRDLGVPWGQGFLLGEPGDVRTTPGGQLRKPTWPMVGEPSST